MSKQFNNKPSILISVPLKYKELIKTIIRVVDNDETFESQLDSLLQSKLETLKLKLELLELDDKSKK